MNDELRGRRLAIVVSTAPEQGELDAALELCRAALALEVEAGLFVMSDAVAGLPARRAQLAALVDDGCEVAVCAQSCAVLGLSEDDVGLPLGSQDDHAAIVSRADRLVALT